AGMDLFAAVAEPLVLEPGEIVLVPTGIAVAIPAGYEGQIRARSGLAVSHGLAVINGPGTIDSDYRGEVKVALINLGKKSFTIQGGDRIAQLVVSRVYRVAWQVRDKLDDTERNSGGFGHSGV
ncbi:MAG: dUTP diphosphatase, partial [Deltaproteobacteria bacterium]|nr:dUTP diphosphatase [Deltaproteobacteria bacterium]